VVEEDGSTEKAILVESGSKLHHHA